jgi:hypothetical protein
VASYRLDSLVSVELQNWDFRFLGGHMQTLELMSSMSMVQLAGGTREAVVVGSGWGYGGCMIVFKNRMWGWFGDVSMNSTQC